ncbi:hypothetical protein IMCC12053_2199 [Celeribacter marinus]|uniref:Uncharacterized protein n=1 Tax=Celeribacter marinus TaxID=1397108 RepID=A0A0P0A0C7_9RHOB|nr:hypothetical protein IMCC12053_2199 [Celeribacter marinus]
MGRRFSLMCGVLARLICLAQAAKRVKRDQHIFGTKGRML